MPPLTSLRRPLPLLTGITGVAMLAALGAGHVGAVGMAGSSAGGPAGSAVVATSAADPSPDPGTDPAAGSATGPADQSPSTPGPSPAPSSSPPAEDGPTASPAPGAEPSAPETRSALADRAERIAARAAASAASETPYSFVLSAFNILGTQHTAPGAHGDRYAPGRIRTEWAAQVMEQHGSDVIGLSEIQPDQFDSLMSTTRGEFDAWPGRALGYKGVPQTLIWRRSMFEAVEKSHITIPFVGQQRPQPVVRLRHLQTGRELYVINAHNSPNHRQAERDRAVDIEIATIRELEKTGLPVFFVGDLNDKERVFCAVTSRTGLDSPAGGSNDGTCRPPRGMRVDWIFGSGGAWSGYRVDRSPIVARVTDHAVLAATVTIS